MTLWPVGSLRQCEIYTAANPAATHFLAVPVGSSNHARARAHTHTRTPGWLTTAAPSSRIIKYELAVANIKILKSVQLRSLVRVRLVLTVTSAEREGLRWRFR